MAQRLYSYRELRTATVRRANGQEAKAYGDRGDRDIINIIRINFELKGFDVYGCPKSSRGLAESLVELPDAIILDLLMPDKNGWEVLEELKTNPVTRDIPVIICSMMKRPRAIEKAKEMGAFAYIRKPFDTSELIAMVEGAIYRG